MISWQLFGKSPGSVVTIPPGCWIMRDFHSGKTICSDTSHSVRRERIRVSVAETVFFQFVCKFPKISFVQIQQDEGGNDNQQVGFMIFPVFIFVHRGFCQWFEQDAPDKLFAFPQSICGGEG